jgi:hypothetical protein
MQGRGLLTGCHLRVKTFRVLAYSVADPRSLGSGSLVRGSSLVVADWEL